MTDSEGSVLKRIVIFANPDKPEALALARRTETRLEAAGFEVFLATRLGEDLTVYRPDVAAVFGGDGTVLGAVAGLGREPPPIVAFNLGHLGYLACNPPEDAEKLILDALEGKLQTSRRMTIQASLESPRLRWTGLALNEFVLSSSMRGRQLPLSVWVDGKQLMDIRGDGLIAATPTGSTAYALSAGGPVVSPELSAIILEALCPHQLANRSLVLDPAETIRVRHFCDQPAELTADGRFCLNMERGEALDISVASTTVRLLSEPQGKYTLLREKLGWGWKMDSGRRAPTACGEAQVSGD